MILFMARRDLYFPCVFPVVTWLEFLISVLFICFIYEYSVESSECMKWHQYDEKKQNNQRVMNFVDC